MVVKTVEKEKVEERRGGNGIRNKTLLPSSFLLCTNQPTNSLHRIHTFSPLAFTQGEEEEEERTTAFWARSRQRNSA